MSHDTSSIPCHRRVLPRIVSNWKDQLVPAYYFFLLQPYPVMLIPEQTQHARESVSLLQTLREAAKQFCDGFEDHLLRVIKCTLLIMDKAEN